MVNDLVHESTKTLRGSQLLLTLRGAQCKHIDLARVFILKIQLPQTHDQSYLSLINLPTIFSLTLI